MWPLSIPFHHSEPGDPALLEWMRQQIDAVVGLGPAAMLVTLALAIAAIPIGIGLAYWANRGRQRRGGA